jgi:hypothetical protein
MEKMLKKKGPAEKRTSADSPVVQRKSVNSTRLPDSIQTGAERMSGMSLDDIRVHYNSPKPAQLNAHAYAQGTDVHVAPGQEADLPHEAWHVVQQKQGRVAPTMQMKGLAVNNASELEREADSMGDKILQAKMREGERLSEGHGTKGIVQLASEYSGIMPSHDITLDKLAKDKKDPKLKQMKLTYHHIIPEGILKDIFTRFLLPVYEHCLKNDKEEGASDLVKAVNTLISTGQNYRKNTRENDQKTLGKESGANHTFEFSEDMPKETEKEKIEERKKAIDGDFGGAIRWIPGNIHQGPSDRTHVNKKQELSSKKKFEGLYHDRKYDSKFIRENPEFLVGDGGEGFEYAAVNVVGEKRMDQLGKLMSDMFNLSGGSVSKIDTNMIKAVKAIIETIDSLYYEEEKEGKQFIVPIMNLDQWEETENKKWQLKNEDAKKLITEKKKVNISGKEKTSGKEKVSSKKKTSLSQQQTQVKPKKTESEKQVGIKDSSQDESTDETAFMQDIFDTV